ncbi:hypothetical protein J22TS3_07010 [Paenibacillus sp. J22TS3]|nr:hypothetical protein J22TS3_07010 [Paenibacillus sp. J22TS3]
MSGGRHEVNYKVILQNKYDLTPLVESISLRDSLDQIAYQATITLVVNDSLPAVDPGQEIRVSGIPFGGSGMVTLLHPGVVWECESSGSPKRLTLTVYDKTIYLDRSEDEYLFPKGQTANERMRKYAQHWHIPLDKNMPDTKTKLGRAMYRTQTIYSMMTNDLRETAKLGGDLFHPRMVSGGLTLYKLGSNSKVYVLENLTEASQSRTLEGAVTEVKVLGTSDSAGEETPSKVLAIAKGQTDKLGTLLKIVQDDSVKTEAAAKKLAASKLAGVQRLLTVTGLDVNTIRAGDVVMLSGQRLIVTSVSRELKSAGTMTLELAPMDDVRRRFYLE